MKVISSRPAIRPLTSRTVIVIELPEVVAQTHRFTDANFVSPNHNNITSLLPHLAMPYLLPRPALLNPQHVVCLIIRRLLLIERPPRLRGNTCRSRRLTGRLGISFPLPSLSFILALGSRLSFPSWLTSQRHMAHFSWVEWPLLVSPE